MRIVTVEERRGRLARRHRLAPGHKADNIEVAADSLVGLHATDLSTVHLAAWARVDGLHAADVDDALYDRRTLVTQLAMRRTLFTVTRARLAEAVHGAGRRVAAAQDRALVRDVERAGLHADGAAWLRSATNQVLEALDDGRCLTTAELRSSAPRLDDTIPYALDKPWGGNLPVAPRVLTVLSARGDVARGFNAGTWMAPRPTWATMATWLGAPLPELDADDARRALVVGWLRSFGPGTVADIQWWLGDTKGNVQRALRAADAVEVGLEGSAPGYLLPDDLEPEEPVEPWAALLPTLDPTTMGWRDRPWYLGPHRALLFDSVGNAGTTAWWNGRIVGGWHQPDGGQVVVRLVEDVDADGRRALDQEATRLTDWLGGARPGSRWRSPLFADDT